MRKCLSKPKYLGIFILTVFYNQSLWSKYKTDSAKVQKLIFNNNVDGRKDEKKQLIIITSQ